MSLGVGLPLDSSPFSLGQVRVDLPGKETHIASVSENSKKLSS